MSDRPGNITSNAAIEITRKMYNAVAHDIVKTIVCLSNDANSNITLHRTPVNHLTYSVAHRIAMTNEAVRGELGLSRICLYERSC